MLAVLIKGGNNIIPKIIHYCWLSNEPFSDDAKTYKMSDGKYFANTNKCFGPVISSDTVSHFFMSFSAIISCYSPIKIQI